MSTASSLPPRRSARVATSGRGGAARAKRAVNLNLSADVLDEAKRLGFNVSQLCDAYLREKVRHEQERLWRQEHADFIAAYNATVAAEGLPLDEWRSF